MSASWGKAAVTRISSDVAVCDPKLTLPTANYRIARGSFALVLAASRKLSQSWIVTLVNHPARAVASDFLRLLLRLLRRGHLLNTSHSIRLLLTKAFELNNYRLTPVGS